MRFLLLLVFSFVVTSCVPVYADDFEYRYPVDLVRIVDGDTMDVDVHMGLGIKMTVRLRVKDLDTPETWRPETEAEAIHGHAATLHAAMLLGDRFIIRSYGWAVYNRVEADIELSDGSDFAEAMIQAGFEKRDHYE